MFLQFLTEHQGHILSKFIIAVVVVSGFLSLFALFNKKRTKTKPNEPEILNFSEQAKRKTKSEGIESEGRNKK